jgi:hypothetical protein
VSGPEWHLNPQYLLVVKDNVEVNIRLTQPEKQDLRISFYVLEYSGILCCNVYS